MKPRTLTFSLKLFRTYKNMINRGNIPIGVGNITLSMRKSKRIFNALPGDLLTWASGRRGGVSFPQG